MDAEPGDMSAEEETERVAVRTYVPAYQREEWRERAESMDMSASEFVRTMVQAGVRDFDFDADGGNTVEPDAPPTDPGGNDLDDRVLDVLAEEGVCSWDELLAALTDDIEDRLEETIAELQSENAVVHSPREGGYRVVEDE